MTADARRSALTFLIGQQLLSPDEAEGALAIAAEVLRSSLARLAAAADAGDGPGCAEAAHALKGNILNLGLPLLARIAQQAWDRARQGDTAAVKALCPPLHRALAPLLTSRSD